MSIGGPGGFSRTVAASQTLSGLAAGELRRGGRSGHRRQRRVRGQPGHQTVTVTEGATPAPAAVTYAVEQRHLTVTVAGLPAGHGASVTVTGPGGFNETLTASQTFTSLVRGATR